MNKLQAITDKNGKLLGLYKTEIKEEKIKTIYTSWLAAALRDEGFSILRERANPNHPMLNCWDFEDTPELQTALIKLTKNK